MRLGCRVCCFIDLPDNNSVVVIHYCVNGELQFLQAGTVHDCLNRLVNMVVAFQALKLFFGQTLSRIGLGCFWDQGVGEVGASLF